MMLPGVAALAAHDARRLAAAEATGRRIVEMVHEDLRPSQILTEKSFENAIRAIGKSLGREAESGLRKLIPERLLFLSKIQEPLSPKNTLSSGSLKTLLGYATKSIQPPERPGLKYFLHQRGD